MSRILVAGVGNIFLGDDGFGVEVAQRLARESLPPGVRVADFGIRGFDLAYALLEDVDAAIIVDTIPSAGAPGTLHVIEAETHSPGMPQAGLAIETHAMDPAKVLQLAATLGSRVQRVLVVGCEPQALGSDEEMAMGLSPPVEAAVPQAVDLVKSLVHQLLETPLERPAEQSHVSQERSV